jgi:hypothetical protein
VQVQTLGVVQCQFHRPSYEVLSTTIWSSSFVRRRTVLLLVSVGAARCNYSRLQNGAEEARARGGLCRGEANRCLRAPFCYPPRPTGGGAETRSLDFRWWAPERLHDAPARMKFGKSSKTHLFFKVR